MAIRKDIIPPGMEIISERFRYAPGVLVDDTLYIAGQVGRNEALEVISVTEAQFVQAFENVRTDVRQRMITSFCILLDKSSNDLQILFCFDDLSWSVESFVLSYF